MRKVVAALVAAGLIVACEQSLNDPLPSDPGIPLQFTLGSCDNTDPGGDSFSKHWTCGQSVTIRQSGTGPDFSSAIGNAASAWSLGQGLPTFSYTTSGSSSINVVRHGGTGGGTFCGTTNAAGTQIDIYPSGHSTCTTGGFWTGTADRIMLHELGHAVGLDAPYHNFDVSGYSDHCAINLPSGTGSTLTADVPCDAEMEEVFYKYSVRTSAPDWGNHFIQGTIPTLSSGTVRLGGSVTGYDTLLLVDRGNANVSLCPDPYDDEGWRCLPIGSATISWSTAAGPSPAGSASVAGAVITGTGPGNVWVYATLSGTGGYQTTTPFEAASFRNTNSLQVTSIQLILISGGSQVGLVGAALTDSFKVQLRDSAAPYAAIAGRQVTFAATSGGGSISPTTATTDANGYAASLRTLGGSSGTNGSTATVSGAYGSPLSIPATGATLTAPTAFSRQYCNLYNGESGDTLIEHVFTWTPATLPAWEVGMASVNDSGSASVIGSGPSGGFTYGPLAKGGFPTGNRYFFVRATYGASRSAWRASSNNPINVTGTISGCQW